MAQQVVAEVDEDGEQRADVAGHVEGRPNCSASQPKKALRENQVGGARHGQELGESLDHAEQRRLEEQHGAGSPGLRHPHVAAAASRRPLDGFLDGHGRAAGRGLRGR